MGILIYRIIESIDGEKYFHLIPYKLGQKIKVFCLKYLITD
jgi:hypothetical protein